MAEVQISMINSRGRVVWVDESRVTGLREIGWRVIVNPKEKYYPQYDQIITNRQPDDEYGDGTHVVDDVYRDVLGIIVI